MGKLDAKGVIAVLEVIIYIPILCTSLFLVKRHGFKRTAGWIFFVLFSLGEASLIFALTSHTDSPNCL